MRPLFGISMRYSFCCCRCIMTSAHIVYIYVHFIRRGMTVMIHCRFNHAMFHRILCEKWMIVFTITHHLDSRFDILAWLCILMYNWCNFLLEWLLYSHAKSSSIFRVCMEVNFPSSRILWVLCWSKCVSYIVIQYV